MKAFSFENWSDSINTIPFLLKVWKKCYFHMNMVRIKFLC